MSLFGQQFRFTQEKRDVTVRGKGVTAFSSFLAKSPKTIKSLTIGYSAPSSTESTKSTSDTQNGTNESVTDRRNQCR